MKNLFKIASLVAIFSLFAACNDKGIFYSLENEELVQEKNNLNNSAIFSNMVKIGNYYFGNAGTKIYYRNISSDSTLDDWSELALPNGSDNTPVDANEPFSSYPAVTSMVQIGTELYISMSSASDSYFISGIFRVSPSDPSSVISSSWTPEIKTVVERTSTTHDSNIYRLFSTGTGLYINRVNFTYTSFNDNIPDTIPGGSSLFYTASPNLIDYDLNNTTSIDISTFAKYDADSEGVVENMIAKVENIVYDGTANYWLIINGESEGKLYKSTDATTFNPVAASPASVRYVDIFAYDATRLLLTDTAGLLHIYNGSAFRELTNSDVWLKGFARLDTLGTTNQLIIGTIANKTDTTNDGEGYVQLNVSSSDDGVWDWVDINFSDENNYLSSDLSGASITGFLADGDRLFAYTAANGVWINEVDQDDNTKRIWAIE
ncbi:MAG: hypothetical protein JXR86_07610 [Spirochaetales bacterium]|nr:hypothetical protein [Spirochaetales bacterium]